MLPPAKSHSQLGGAAALPWVTLEAARLRKPPRRVPARVAQQGPLDNDNPHHGRTGSREAGPCPGGSWSGPTRVRWPRRAGHRPSRGHLGSGPCDTPGAHPGLGCGTCQRPSARATPPRTTGSGAWNPTVPPPTSGPRPSIHPVTDKDRAAARGGSAGAQAPPLPPALGVRPPLGPGPGASGPQDPMGTTEGAPIRKISI